MILYHGSNVTVEMPKIFPQLRALDFGAGFYLTSNRQQAQKWARNVYNRKKTGIPTLNMYAVEEKTLEVLNVLTFETANENWLDFVVKNRMSEYKDKLYDIVVGPVANDTTIRIVDDYMSGVYTRDEAIKRLLPQKLTDQYAFLTEKALSLLTFDKSEVL
ncbi:MAG: DUF3990 domain-containing protein [Fibrobacter sp.]|nr:DUF3990 domain-containing protein [Fibrobacter sp.]